VESYQWRAGRGKKEGNWGVREKRGEDGCIRLLLRPKSLQGKKDGLIRYHCWTGERERIHIWVYGGRRLGEGEANHGFNEKYKGKWRGLGPARRRNKKREKTDPLKYLKKRIRTGKREVGPL